MLIKPVEVVLSLNTEAIGILHRYTLQLKVFDEVKSTYVNKQSRQCCRRELKSGET